MTAHLSVEQVLSLHQSLVGHLSEAGVLDVRALESAVSRPTATFEGADLYASLDATAAFVSGPILGAPFLSAIARRRSSRGSVRDRWRGLVATDWDPTSSQRAWARRRCRWKLTVWFRNGCARHAERAGKVRWVMSPQRVQGVY
jgi:hypothetical protein